MPVYKFLNTQHIDKCLAGNLIIRSLAYYRKLEGAQWIADRLEGAVEIRVDGLTITGAGEAAGVTPEGFTPLAKTDSTSKIQILDNVVFRYEVPNCFILCLSRGDLISLTKTMCNNKNSNYDACMSINDAALLAHRMFYRGRITEFKRERVSSYFSAVTSAEVTYENLQLSRSDGKPRAPSPFVKHIVFGEQREVRIVFWPKRPLAAETLTVEFPKPAAVLKEIFRGR